MASRNVSVGTDDCVGLQYLLPIGGMMPRRERQMFKGQGQTRQLDNFFKFSMCMKPLVCNGRSLVHCRPTSDAPSPVVGATQKWKPGVGSYCRDIRSTT